MITVYSKNSCPNCDKAKAYLNSKNIEYNEIKVDEVPEAREFLLAEGHRSVPQFYNNGVLIEGGYAGLMRMELKAA